MMKTIIDTISGVVICSKNPKKTLEERLAFHNSTFNYRYKGTHYPQNAYYIEDRDTIYIKRRD